MDGTNDHNNNANIVICHTKNGNTNTNTNTNTNNSITDYFSNLCEKVSKNVCFHKNQEKIDSENIYVPNFDESDYLCRYKYSLPQLKTIARKYKLKITGNKTQLIQRIYSFLYLSNLCVKIQKCIRGYIQRKYNKCHGPAFVKRALCTNACDFLSMDELTNIPYNQFFSFEDSDGFIYGFDLVSFYNLVSKSEGPIKNPYNQQPIIKKAIELFACLLRLSRILKIDVSISLADVNKEVTDAKSLELRCLTLFQNIDALGNYSNAQWFLSLNRIQLIRFLRELMEIWGYRAPLTIETKRSIIPPLGNPFTRMPNFNYLQTTEHLDDVRKVILGIMEKFVTTGVDKDSKCLGAYYVLGALTLVSQEAAIALPWLYQAVCYM
jgi:hypothetical protein